MEDDTTAQLNRGSSEQWSPLGALRQIADLAPEKLQRPEHWTSKWPSVAVAKATLTFLIRYADANGDGARPSLRLLARNVGIQQRMMRYTIRALEFLGLIKQTARERFFHAVRGFVQHACTYALKIGFEAHAMARKITVRTATDGRAGELRAAYKIALEDRHGSDHFKPIAEAVWCSYVDPIAELAKEHDQPFTVCAAVVMRRYMSESGRADGELVEKCHPPGWLDSYLPGILRDIRKSEKQRQAERDEAARRKSAVRARPPPSHVGVELPADLRRAMGRFAPAVG